MLALLPQSSPNHQPEIDSEDFAERDEVSGVRRLPRFVHEALRDVTAYARLLPPEILDMSAHARLLPPEIPDMSAHASLLPPPAPASGDVRRALRFLHIFECLATLDARATA